MSRDGYRFEWLQGERSGRAHVRAALEALRTRYAIAGRDVLEIGSGTGVNLEIFAADNRVLGLEVLSGAVGEACAQGVPTVQVDLEQLPWPVDDASVDWLLCLDVVEHLLHPDRCLVEALRVLRPDGRIVLNLPNHFDWRGRLRLLAGSGIDSQHYFADAPVWRYPHLRFLRRCDLFALLESIGLEVEEELSTLKTSIPKEGLLRQVGLGPLVERTASMLPEWLLPGFLLVCRRAAAG